MPGASVTPASRSGRCRAAPRSWSAGSATRPAASAARRRSWDDRNIDQERAEGGQPVGEPDPGVGSRANPAALNAVIEVASAATATTRCACRGRRLSRDSGTCAQEHRWRRPRCGDRLGQWRPPARALSGSQGPRRAPRHAARKLSCSTLHVGGGQDEAQPGSQPWRVPGEQLPQRSVVAGGHRGDQLVVVHCFSIAFGRQQVHRRRQLPGICSAAASLPDAAAKYSAVTVVAALTGRNHG